MFALVTLLIFLINRIWVLFRPIQIIKINIKDKFFILTPRNLVKKLFISSTKIFFTEIKKFEISEGPEITLEPTRFIISAILKDSSNTFFSQTARKETAKGLLTILNEALSIQE